jgi:hypothetical protein
VLLGHINLAASMNGTAEHFVSLTEALQRAGLRQHVLVRNATLAERIKAIADIAVGPVVQSPVMAYCLMPRVDLVHVHEPAAGHAGLLLTLTRSIPYILTHRGATKLAGNPLLQAVYRRAAIVICQDDSEIAMLRHRLPGLAPEIIPDVDRHGSAAGHLRLYQNSQRNPIAGSRGIQ